MIYNNGFKRIAQELNFDQEVDLDELKAQGQSLRQKIEDLKNLLVEKGNKDLQFDKTKVSQSVSGDPAIYEALDQSSKLFDSVMREFNNKITYPDQDNPRYQGMDGETIYYSDNAELSAILQSIDQSLNEIQALVNSWDEHANSADQVDLN
jgi:hypothetical protein